MSEMIWTLPRLGFVRPSAAPIVWGIRLGALAALAVWALSTPGFLSLLSLFSLLNAISFIGCVAVGMTFITLTGNIMSLCLGATVVRICDGVSGHARIRRLAGIRCWRSCSASSSLPLQGAVVGCFEANPILVSIAALSLDARPGADHHRRTARLSARPGHAKSSRCACSACRWSALFFFAAVIAGQIVLSFTALGLAMVMVGSNAARRRRRDSAVTHVITMAYVLAGAFSAISGVLLVARYGCCDMELGAGYDYSAIAAVLVGGTAIQGGSGSVVRTLIGVTVIAMVEVVLLLRGFSDQMQYLITGLIVLAVIMLHAVGEQALKMRAALPCCSVPRCGLSPSCSAPSSCWR